MEVPQIVWIAGGAAALAAVMMYVFSLLRLRKASLTHPESPDQKPEWMETTPPLETVTATQADGAGIRPYDHDDGERLAAPFAEQIEDIVRARLSADPALAAMDVDLGTASDGGLEIWVDGACYTDVDALPDERLRQVFRQAIEEWDA
ncbi:MAG: hypothetical protein U9R15_20785 [Chloroflexota bacterium]|nr:hypothetical protein [Chloroflexota bacterium]